MSLRKIMIATLAVTILVASAIIYSNANQNHNDAADIAIEFLVNSPTFSFDGVQESIQIIDQYTLESYPIQHIVIIAFNTTHAGWGNREGTFSAQVITPHIIKITIVEGQVVSAVIDEKWDEISQTQIIPEELILTENARDMAIQYILENHPDLELEIPECWVSSVTTEPNMVGSSKIRYQSDNWDILLSYPVVQYPDYEVSIHYSGETAFSWSGTVTNTSTVNENSFIN